MAADRVEPQFVLFGKAERESAQLSKITNDILTRSGTVGVKGLTGNVLKRLAHTELLRVSDDDEAEDYRQDADQYT